LPYRAFLSAVITLAEGEPGRLLLQAHFGKFHPEPEDDPRKVTIIKVRCDPSKTPVIKKR
jgi:hypothetical protein